MCPRRIDSHSDAAALPPLQGFRPDVQALRGLAVLAVVLYHAGIVLPGGYVGVDIFFVISGFVIGRLLISELSTTNSLPIKNFYVRRARRLLPALAAMLVFVLLLTPLLAPIAANTVTHRTGVSTALFSANFYLFKATSGGYFAPRSDFNPLLHTWSLPVEEQFYFALPAFLYIAWRIGKRRGLSVGSVRTLIGVVFVGSLGACLYLSYANRVGPLDGLRLAFFSSFTRAWEFAAGLAIVVIPFRWFSRPCLRGALAGVGLALILASIMMFDETTCFPGIAALAPVAGAASLIAAGTPCVDGLPQNAWLGKARPLIWIGDYSYSWYLWHWPLIVFAGAFWPNSGATPLVLAGAASLLPAWLSYGMLEKRLRVKGTVSTRWTVLIAACCLVAPLAAAMVSSTIETALAKRVSASLGLFERADFARGCNNPTAIGDRSPDTCTWSSPGNQGTVFLVGDSNAGHFIEAMIGATAADDLDLRVANLSGCPFIDVDVQSAFTSADCSNFVESSMEMLELRPPEVVVIANGTDIYLGDDVSLVDPVTGPRPATVDERASALEAGLQRVVKRLSLAGSKVVVINVVPKPGDRDPRRCSRLRLLVDPSHCLPSFRSNDDDVLIAANKIENQATLEGGGTIWNFNDEICPNDRCVGSKKGQLVWVDSGHISVNESRSLVTLASQLLAALVGR